MLIWFKFAFVYRLGPLHVLMFLFNSYSSANTAIFTAEVTCIEIYFLTLDMKCDFLKYFHNFIVKPRWFILFKCTAVSNVYHWEVGKSLIQRLHNIKTTRNFFSQYHSHQGVLTWRSVSCHNFLTKCASECLMLYFSTKTNKILHFLRQIT